MSLSRRLSSSVVWILVIELFLPLLWSPPIAEAAGVAPHPQAKAQYVPIESASAEVLTAHVPIEDANLNLADLPTHLLPALPEMLGNEHAEYHVYDDGTARRAANPAQQFDTAFTSGGIQINAPDGNVRLQLTGYGTVGNVRPTQASTPNAEDAVLLYQYPNLTEWYINSSQGLEQGFTFKAAPSHNNDTIVIRMSVSGTLKASLSANGRAISFANSEGNSVLLYRGLTAWDATGKILPTRMTLVGQQLTLYTEAKGAQYPLYVDPIFILNQTIFAGDGEQYDFFGNDVAVDGDTMVVGASEDDEHGYTNEGSAYVFTRTSGGWSEQQKFVMPDGTISPWHFGESVAVQGNRIVIGATKYDGHAGAAYVYIKSGSTWVLEQKLTPVEGLGDVCLTCVWRDISVDLDGNLLVIGAPQDFGDFVNGTAYVYEWDGSSWVYRWALTADDGQSQDAFGSEVEVQGNTIVVTAPADDDPVLSQGSAYVFERVGDNWNQTQKLTASDPLAMAIFGDSLALDGNRLIIGAPHHNSQQGAAYVYVKDGSSWTFQQKLLNPAPATEGRFGKGVAVSGDKIVATTVPTSAYVFKYNGTSWIQDQVLGVGDPTSFWRGVAISDGQELIALGSWFEAATYPYQGVVRIYDTGPSTVVPEEAVAGAVSGSGYRGATCPCDMNMQRAGQATANSINTRTGNSIYQQVDLSLPGLAGSLAFSRSYSSFNAQSVANGSLIGGVLSPGWNHSYEVRLLFSDQPGGANGKVMLMMAEGSRLAFIGDNTGGYTPDVGVGGTFTYNSATDEYLYTNAQDGGYIFFGTGNTALRGRLKAINHPNGAQLTLTYDANSNLQQIADTTGQHTLTLQYEEHLMGQFRLTRVTDNASRYIEFGYTAAPDSGFNLAWMRDLRGQYWAYEYVNSSNHPELGTIPNWMLHVLAARRGPTSTPPNPVTSSPMIVAYQHDAQGRAYRETNAAGEIMVDLNFNGSTTTISYGSGGAGGSATHTYNPTRRVIEVQGTNAGSSTTLFDANFRLSYLQDANGNLPTTLKWSADGIDLLRIDDPLNPPTAFTYDSAHNLVFVNHADGTRTRFVYNTPQMLDLVTGTTTVPNPDYVIGLSAHLLLKRIDDFGSGHTNLMTRYEYTNGSGGQPANLVAKVISTDGIASCYSYNAFGQQTQIFENCVDRTPSPNIPDDILTTFTYDSVGRLDTVTDPLGHVTKQVYLDEDSYADEVITHYDASKSAYQNGLWNFSNRVFRDANGREIAVVQNYWDPNSNGTLTASEISAGLPDHNLVSRIYYDAAGRVQYVVQNFVGDIFSATPPAIDSAFPDRNIVTRIFYDAAGRSVATVNNYKSGDLPGTGSPQAIDFDGNGTTDVTLEVSPQASEYNQITRTSYDNSGRVSMQTTAAWPGQVNYYQGTYNHVTAYEYDRAGNVLKIITNYDPSISTGYSVSLNLIPDPAAATDTTIRVDPNLPERNIITCTSYDALNRPKFVREACVPGQVDYLVNGSNLYNLVSAIYYDTMGRAYASVRNYEDPDSDGVLILSSTRNFITRTYYDTLGRVDVVVTNFVGDIASSSQPAYDPATPDRNVVTKYLYDGQGRQYATVLNYWDPDGASLSEANIIAGLPDRNLITRIYYNTQGQVSQTVANFVGDLTDPALPTFSTATPDRNLTTAYTYDTVGRQVEVIADRGSSGSRKTHVDFDPLGRVSQSYANYQDGTPGPGTDVDLLTTFQYNLLDYQTQVTAPASRVQQMTYDALGRITQGVVDPGSMPHLNLTTTTAYDVAGRAIQMTNGENEVIATLYDAWGRTTSTTQDPGSAPHQNLITISTYDVLGRVLTTTNPQNIVTRYKYDNLGRLVQVFENFQGGAPTCGVATNDQNVCTRHQYDAAGNRTQTILANGSTTTYLYDSFGRLIRETLNPGTTAIVTEYRYDTAGNPVEVKRAPGTASEQITIYTFDALGRQLNINYPPGTADVTYTYHPFGGRATMIDGMGTWNYAYDGLNRLTNISGPNGNNVAYTYDANGNRQTLSASGMAINYTYDAANRLDTISDPFAGGSNVIDYSYDKAHRVTGITRPGTLPTTGYVYDDASRLTSIQHGTGGNLSTFTYTLDPRGNRTDISETLALPTLGALPTTVVRGSELPADVFSDNTIGTLFARALAPQPATPTTRFDAPNQPIAAVPVELPASQGVSQKALTTAFSEMQLAAEAAGPTPTASADRPSTLACLPELDTEHGFGADMHRHQNAAPRSANGALATERETYRARFEETGLRFVGLNANAPPSPDLTLALATLRQNNHELVVAPTGSLNSRTLQGWEACDNLAQRQYEHGIVEIVSMQDDHVQIGYLLRENPFAGKASGDLSLELAIDTDLTLHTSSEGTFLLDANGNGVQMGSVIAIDAKGRRTSVEVRSIDGGMALVLPGSWLSKATYPILVDPDLVPWMHTNNSEQDASIAYDQTNNRALVGFTQRNAGNNLYELRARLINASTGQTLNNFTITLGSATPVEVAVGFVPTSQSGAAYLVSYFVSGALYLQRVDVNGNTLGSPVQVFSPRAGIGNLQQIRITVRPGTSTTQGEAVLVWQEQLTGQTVYRVMGVRINDIGSVLFTPFIVDNTNSDTTPQVTYVGADTSSTTDDKYIAAWMRTPATGDTEIMGRTIAYNITSTAGLGSLLTVTNDSDNDSEPSIAYSVRAQRSMIVWHTATNNDIHARGLTKAGALDASTITVTATSTGTDAFPEIAPDPRAATGTTTEPGWVITWQVTNAGTSNDIRQVPMPKNQSSGSISGTTVSVVQTSVSEEDPALVVRSDGKYIIVYENAGPTYGNRTLVVALDAAPTAATLIAPANTSTVQTGNPTYRWQPTGVVTASYALEVRNASNAVVQTATVLGTTCSQTECSATPTPVLPAGQYTWKVTTTTVGGSLASATWSFTVPAEGLHNWRYLYDGLSRVRCAYDKTFTGQTNCTGATFTYTYDGAGNLTRLDRFNKSTGLVQTIRYVYNGANQIRCIDANANGSCGTGETLWTYDAYGNLLFDTTTKYTYDAAMRLMSTCASTNGTTCSGTQTTYQYDGDGNRTAQTVGTTTTTYVLDSAAPLTTVLSETTGGVTIKYLHGLGVVAQSDGSTTKYFLADGLGSVRQVTNASGVLQLSQTFDPYGNPYTSASTSQTSYGYTGEQTDSNGLLFLRARYYDPKTGRFFQPDSWAGSMLSPASLNVYGYGHGNPIRNSDPSGHCVSALELGDFAHSTISQFQHGIPDLRGIYGWGRALWNECASNLQKFEVAYQSAQTDDQKLAALQLLSLPTNLDAISRVAEPWWAGGRINQYELQGDKTVYANDPWQRFRDIQTVTNTGLQVGMLVVAARMAAAPETPLPEIGLLEEVYGLRGNVYLYGFRGIRPPGSYQGPYDNPLLDTGHVGVSFGGRRILGYAVNEELIAQLEAGGVNIPELLKNGGKLPGQVFDDTLVFRQASQLGTQGYNTTVYVQRIIIPAQTHIIAESNYLAQLRNPSLTSTNYMFPVWADKVARIPGIMDPNCYNCATFPRTQGIPIPEQSGFLWNYIDNFLAKTGRIWRP